MKDNNLTEAFNDDFTNGPSRTVQITGPHLEYEESCSSLQQDNSEHTGISSDCAFKMGGNSTSKQ